MVSTIPVFIFNAKTNDYFPFAGTYLVGRGMVAPLAWLPFVELLSHSSSSPDCMLPFHL